MDTQRRYDTRWIADQLDQLAHKLNDLADEEESAFNSRPAGPQLSVSGQDLKEAFEEMRSVAAAISLQVISLYEISEPRPRHAAGWSRSG